MMMLIIFGAITVGMSLFGDKLKSILTLVVMILGLWFLIQFEGCRSLAEIRKENRERRQEVIEERKEKWKERFNHERNFGFRRRLKD